MRRPVSALCNFSGRSFVAYITPTAVFAPHLLPSMGLAIDRELLVGGCLDDAAEAEYLGKLGLVGRLSDHNVTSFVVCVSMFQHISGRVNSRKSVRFQVIDEQKHQRLVVEELLQALERELVEVIIDGNHLHLGGVVVLKQFEHLLGVDETAQVED